MLHSFDKPQLKLFDDTKGNLMTLDSPSAVLVAFIAAMVTAAGWVITNFISRVREDRTRRLELTLAHIERQIEELYGPLLNLIVQIRATWAVQRRLLLEIDQEDRVSTFKIVSS